MLGGLLEGISKMPRIPKYSSQLPLKTGTLTKESSAPRISASVAGIEGRAVAGMGKVIAAVGEKMDAIQAKSQLARANTEAYNAFGQIEQEASQDTNSQGFKERYNTRLKEIKQQISKTITNPRTKNQFSLEYDRDILDTQFRLNKRYNTLIVDEAGASFVQEKEALSEKYYRATTPTEKQLVIDRMGERYNDMFKMGVMTKAGAAEEYKTWKEGLLEGQVDWDILNDPVFTLGELQKGKFGVYKGLALPQRASFIEKAKTRIEKLNKQETEAVAVAMNQRESEFIDMKVAGTLNEQMVLNERAIGQISAKFADSMLNNLRSPRKYEPSSLDKVMKFNELVEWNANIAKREGAWFGIKKVSFDEITKFRADVLDANAKGYITDTQMKDLLKKTSKTFYREPVFQNALNQLAAQSKLYATPEVQARVKAEMYGNLIEKVIMGKEPRVAVNEVIQEKVFTEVEEAVKAEAEANRIFAIKGKQRIYSDDGGETWYDETTNKRLE